jgi:nucleoside-diphosphate-sugar epimerase
MSRHLVTGVAGFIGSQLAEYLLDHGDEIVGLDAFTPYYDRMWKDANLESLRDRASFELVEGDLTTIDLTALVGSADGVYHLAAQPGVRASWGRDFQTYVKDNVLATQRLLEAALNCGRRVVYASSSSVYGDALSYPTPEDAIPRPISPYGITKLTCEHLARAYGLAGLEAIGLRYFTVYGPRQRPDMAFTRIVAALLEGTRFEVFGDGTQSRDVTYVGDAVEATVSAMAKGAPGAVYNVGGGSEASLQQVVAIFERLAGRSLNVTYTGTVRGDVRRTVSDTSALHRDSGWSSRVGLEEGLRAQFGWAQALPGERWSAASLTA